MFDQNALETPLAPLDGLPRSLWLQTLINSVGKLHDRLAAVVSGRAALAAATLPEFGQTWPGSAIWCEFQAALGGLRLPHYCSQSEALTTQVMQSLLWHIDRIVDLRERLPEAEAIAIAAEEFAAGWQEMGAELEEVLYVFDSLDGLDFTRWDATRGLLKQEGWQALIAIRQVLERVPELAAMIGRLGRAEESDEIDPHPRPRVAVMAQVTRMNPRLRETIIAGIATETEGVRRSAEITRMLASESALFAHPRFHLLWKARLAERGLLTYEDRARVSEIVLEPETHWESWPNPEPARRLTMGPLVLAVDTSGSMQGPKERVAKAAVLEALRVAHKQRRACHVIAFGGPGEVVERELGLDHQGVGDLLDFIGQTFHGGTDIADPIEHAINRIRDSSWRLADLVIASDGEFGLTAASTALVNEAKTHLGLRVQGVLIGDRETIGLRAICDDIFWLKDWRKLGEGGEQPVHDKALTALYFPGALT